MTIYDEITVITLYSNKKKFLIKIFCKKTNISMKRLQNREKKKSIEKNLFWNKIHSKKKLKLQKNWNFD